MPAQHTIGHIECPACEGMRASLLRGGGSSPGDSFRRASEFWLESRELAPNLDRARFVKPRTVRDERQYVRALLPFFGVLPLVKIHAGHLRAYQAERSHKASPAKVNQELGMLRRILDAAGAWTPELQLGYTPLAIEAADVPRAMTPDEQARFLEVASSRRAWELVYWYAIAALQSTCTNYEMRGLHMADVNMFERILQVRAAHAKNKYRVRTIPLSEDALWALDRIYQRARGLGSAGPQDCLFPFRLARGAWDVRRPMTESGLKRAFNEVRAAAGLPWLRVHDLRHSAITRMAEAGVPIATIMAMAGHISPRMSAHYTQVSESAKRKAVSVAFDSNRVQMRPKLAGHLERRRRGDRRGHIIAVVRDRRGS